MFNIEKKTAKFGNKSLISHGVHIWPSLSGNIKSSKSQYKLEDFMKNVQVIHVNAYVIDITVTQYIQVREKVLNSVENHL